MQDIKSHLDWVGALYVRYYLRKAILRWTQAWLHLFLVPFMEPDGYARYHLYYHTHGMIRSSLRTAWQALAVSNIKTFFLG